MDILEGADRLALIDQEAGVEVLELGASLFGVELHTKRGKVPRRAKKRQQDSTRIERAPVQETIDATMKEVVRCTKDGIRINTFMLDPDGGLRRFIEQLSAYNGGRAFFTTPDNLGDYVLVDFVEHRRKLLQGRARL